jgi:hypothetical protein
MIEYLKQFETIFAIFLGWLLSLLTMIISENIRRPYRRRDLVRAVVDEMLGLQYTLATVAHLVRARNAQVTDAFLDKILPIFEGYQGPDRSDDFPAGLKKLRSVPEPERAATLQAKQNLNVGMALRQYSIPLFATQIADLAICSRDFQRSVLRIRYHLDLYNQLVPYTQSLFEKTYNKPSPEDRAALIANQERGYRDAGVRAEIIVQLINDLHKSYGA